MKALILAGGFGTRLRPLTCTRPKTLLPIVNKPLLQWTLERLAKNNVKEAILAVNYQTRTAIRQHRIPKTGIHIIYSLDPPTKPLGTGGPIKKAEKLLDHDACFLVLNGDIFADVNYTEILKTHNEKKAIATIALHTVKDPARYGVAELEENNRIKRFIEKPPSGTAPTNLINAGAYVLSPKIFNYIPEGKTISIEREVFPKLAKEGKLYGYIYEGLWTDIGRFEEYLAINKTLIESIANQQECKTGNGTEIRKPVAFDKKVSIGNNSIVGPHVVLGRTVSIGNNVHIQNCVVLRETLISDFATINEALIGEGTSIGKRATIGKKCVLGDHVKIDESISLAERVTICPGKRISESIVTPKSII